jgi:biopolymer transport protein ExbD
MNLKPRRAEEPDINLVSLIDVVLMLVVFFMLSSTFVEDSSLRITLPEASTEPMPRSSAAQLVIAVTEAGSFRVDGRELINASPETLRAAILKVAGADRTAVVTVRADARATHQSVVTAMDVVGRLGFREVNIATVGASSPAGER